jgi:hypothetical protein
MALAIHLAVNAPIAKQSEHVATRLDEPIRGLSLPVSRLIRENVSVLMTFAFSRGPLQEWAAKSLQGEFKQWRETVFGLAEQRAEKACLELAIFLRYLDDEENLSDRYAGYSGITFGYLSHRDGKVTALDLRDVANKVIHALEFQWDLSRAVQPMLVCMPRDSEKWTRASVDVAALSVTCGSLLG